MADYRKFKWLWRATWLISMCVQVQCLYVGDACNNNNVDGICELLNNCPSLMAEIYSLGSPMPAHLANKLNELMCGFEEDDPIVCCSRQMSTSNGTQETTSKSIFNESNATFRGGTVDIQSRIPDISKHRNINLLPTNCGIIADSDRILGGDETSLYQMPWMALLAYCDKFGTVQFNCGGSIINEWYVLTAAHCVSYLDKELGYVVIGEYDVRTDPDCVDDNYFDCAPEVKNMSIDKIIVYPEYNRNTYYDDIALLRVATKMNLSGVSVKPICLPITPQLLSESLIGRNGQVAGWGATEDRGLQSHVLLSVKVPIVTQEVCTNALWRNITERQICAGGVEGQDACSGDSGGPLMYEGKVGSKSVRQVQRGIVSLGLKSCGIKSAGSVYTNVAYYMDWILDNMTE